MKEYSHTYFLTAGECDAESRMPMPLIVSRLIEVATEQANAWGVGYSRLKESGQAWVLSRISVEMMEYPHVNEEYTITTWVESYNRHFSERNFVITAGGEDVPVALIECAGFFQQALLPDGIVAEGEALQCL